METSQNLETTSGARGEEKNFAAAPSPANSASLDRVKVPPDPRVV